MTWKRGQLVSLGCMSRLVADHAATSRPLVGNKFMSRLVASLGFMSRQDWQVDVESSEMRDEIGLRDYLDPGDKNLAPEELGTRIDDCLVHYIENYTGCLTTEDISVEEFELAMGKIEKGKKWDRDYHAFADTLHRRNLRPASETYLELARRDAGYGGIRRPYWELGRDFALVHMDYIRKDDTWVVDWDRERVTKCLADVYLDDPDPVVLQRLIDNSIESPLAWDILRSGIRKAASAGVNPPNRLFTWYVDATNGYPKRPDWRPGPPNRHRTLGRVLRDNEIRHTVDLLTMVGMEEIDGRFAVAEALHLSRDRIREIYKESNSEMPDLAAHAIERLDPSFCLSPREIWPRLRPYFVPITGNQPLPGIIPWPKRIVQICLHSFHSLHTRNISARIGGSSAVSGWKHSPIGGS